MAETIRGMEGTAAAPEEVAASVNSVKRDTDLAATAAEQIAVTLEEVARSPRVRAPTPAISSGDSGGNLCSRLDFKERGQIETADKNGYRQSQIAQKLNRSGSTICRELARWEQFEIPRDEYHSEMGDEANPELLNEVLCGLRKRWSPEQISSRSA